MSKIQSESKSQLLTGNSLLRKTTGIVAKAEPPSINYNRWLKPSGNENPISEKFIAVEFIRRIKKHQNMGFSPNDSNNIL